MLIPVILSGGSGTRLWPLSRELYPSSCCRWSVIAPCCRRPLPAWRGSRIWALRSSSATRATASWLRSSCASPAPSPAGDRARASRPQHRAGRGRGCARRARKSQRGHRPHGRKAPGAPRRRRTAIPARRGARPAAAGAARRPRDPRRARRSAPPSRRAAPPPRPGHWSPSAWCRTGLRLATATSGASPAKGLRTRSPSSSRNRTQRRRPGTSSRATISGTAGCSCSAPAHTFGNSVPTRRRCSRPASAPWPRQSATSISRACRRRSSAPVPATRSTTR